MLAWNIHVPHKSMFPFSGFSPLISAIPGGDEARIFGTSLSEPLANWKEVPLNPSFVDVGLKSLDSVIDAIQIPLLSFNEEPLISNEISWVSGSPVPRKRLALSEYPLYLLYECFVVLTWNYR